MAVATEPTESRRRGRPKGSGIDDHTRLAEIRSHLQRDVGLTPTAAIRAAGFVDPSTIRRLRNKLAGQGSTRPKSSTTNQAVQPPKPTEPPLTPPSTTDARRREADLLAAYMEALSKPTPPVEPPLPQAPGRPDAPDRTIASAPSQPPPSGQSGSAQPQPAPATEGTPPPQPAPSTPFSWPQLPWAPPMPWPPIPWTMPFAGVPHMPGMSPMTGPATSMPFPAMAGVQPSPFAGPFAGPFAAMSIPGMPSFLQPFQPKSPTSTGTSAVRQLEAFKLAIEAMTAIARFQLHLIENAPAYTPMALMLQGQTFIGQMMMASLTGQMDAMRRSSQPAS